MLFSLTGVQTHRNKKLRSTLTDVLSADNVAENIDMIVQRLVKLTVWCVVDYNADLLSIVPQIFIIRRFVNGVCVCVCV